MLATAVQNSKKAESVTRKKDIQEFSELLQPVEEVVSGDEAEEEEIFRIPTLDPNQSSVSEFFTPVKLFSKTPLKSVFFKNNLQFL